MDAVLFYTFQLPVEMAITGSTINAIEYYLTILEHNSDIKLILVNGTGKSRQKIIDLAKNRYHLDDLDFEDNIICLEKGKLMRQGFQRVLVLDYSTIQMTRDILVSKKIIVIQEKEDYKYDNLNSKNLIHYGEMPWQYKDHEYRMKMLFDRFKELGTVKSGLYVNSPKNRDYDFLKHLDLPDKPIIFKARSHLDNMFEQFDEYLYWHANTWFDPHPRLFAECYFYGKKSNYHNIYGIQDGSFYRYHDMMERGIEDRTLNKDDEVVRHFI